MSNIEEGLDLEIIQLEEMLNEPHCQAAHQQTTNHFCTHEQSWKWTASCQPHFINVCEACHTWVMSLPERDICVCSKHTRECWSWVEL